MNRPMGVLAAMIATAIVLFLPACGRRSPTPVGRRPASSSSGVSGQAPSVSPSVLGTMRATYGTLVDARKATHTRLSRRSEEGTRPDSPPSGTLSLVRYNSPAGALWAYVSEIPQDGKRHPAIIWLHGGFDNGIDASAWIPQPAENDQSGSAFWNAGVVTMHPSYRGGNDNPGESECLLGEVDDVIAAAAYLAKQPGIDPDRIYLGGHSTGGTLALLVAESTDRFRCTFAFGPIDIVTYYGADNLPFDASDPREYEPRSPAYWLDSIRRPVEVIEGASGGSNIEALEQLHLRSKNHFLRFHPVVGADHFSTLAPITRLIARKILEDEGPSTKIVLGDEELNELFRAGVDGAPSGR